MKLFTSEFVSQGHPDRFCDIISNAILDECLKQDSNSRVAVEALAKDDKVILGGEITTEASFAPEQIVEGVAANLGYDFIPKVTNLLGKQSPDIALGTNDEVNGAGDQGIMFGYATTDGPEYMPLAWSLARDIIKEFETLRKNNTDYAWVKADMKSQVTIDYSEAIPKVNAVVISIQTTAGTDLSYVKEKYVVPTIKKIISNEVYSEFLNADDEFSILFNETGKFEIGGPFGDCGVTGRKIVVDQYGGYAPVGGGNLNGKDATKVDRSAAYMMRYLAKNLVASGLLSDCTIQIAYCIGVDQPVSLTVKSTDEHIDEWFEDLEDRIASSFDLSPAGIIKFLKLKEPNYVETSKYGHYGNNYATWEQIDNEFLSKIGMEQ